MNEDMQFIVDFGPNTYLDRINEVNPFKDEEYKPADLRAPELEDPMEMLMHTELWQMYRDYKRSIGEHPLEAFAQIISDELAMCPNPKYRISATIEEILGLE